MGARIRPETEADRAAVRRVNESAFGGRLEADLVDALRGNGAVPELCLVAEEGDELVGHICFSEATLDSGHAVLALAPMAVAPARQRSGIGSGLMLAGLEHARTTASALVVVVGHPEYYPRFGFERASALGLDYPGELPDEAWMALRLPGYDPAARGLVAYAPPFAELG
jgi:putative acetyltransferase